MFGVSEILKVFIAFFLGAFVGRYLEEIIDFIRKAQKDLRKITRAKK